MNNIALNSLTQKTIESFTNRFTLSPLHKIILAIALAAFAIIAFCYSFTNTSVDPNDVIRLRSILQLGDLNQLLVFLKNVKGKVTKLDLTHFKTIDDANLEALIKQCPYLHTLIIGNCDQITDKGMAHIQGLYLLKNLKLLKGCDQITDAGLEKLKKLYSLTDLTLVDCKGITGLGLTHLAVQPFTRIELKGNSQIKGKDFNNFAKLTSLTDLHLNDFDHLTDDALKVFTTLTFLKKISFSGCSQITDGGLLAIAENCKNINSIELSRCSKISNQSPEFLTKFLSLREIDLSSCPNLTDASFDSMTASTNTPALESLNLSHCQGITDKTLQNLQNFTHLKNLKLNHCDQLTNDGIKCLPASLNILSLSDLTNLSDEGIKDLVPQSTKLLKLYLDGCVKLTKDCLTSLKKFPALRLLNLKRCPGIEKDEFLDFQLNANMASTVKKYFFWSKS